MRPLLSFRSGHLATCPVIPSPLLLPESSFYESQNKRKHDVVSKRPKYVEVDSDVDELEVQNQTSSEDECECTCSKESSGLRMLLT